MWLSADFGPDAAGAPVGLTQIGSAGVPVVERTSSGIVPVGAGVFGIDLTPDPLCVMVRWDTGGCCPLFAVEDLPPQGSDPSAVALAVLAAASATPISAEVKIINGVTLAGSGTELDPMRPA